MRKLTKRLWILFVFLPVLLFGQDTKISDLTRITVPGDSTRFLVVYDSSGTKVSRQWVWEDMTIAMRDSIFPFVEEDSVWVISTTSTKPILYLENDNDDAGAAAMYFIKDSDSPAATDKLGSMLFLGYNNAAQLTEYGRIESKIDAVTDGAEDGNVKFYAMHNGSLEAFLYLETEGTADVHINPDHNDIGFKVGTAAGTAISVNGTTGTSGVNMLFQALAGILLDDSLRVGDDDFIGLGTGKGRLVFDDQATDEVNIMDANVGIGTIAPAHKLHLVGNIALGDTTTGDTDAIIYFGDDAAVTSEYFKWDDGDDRFEVSDALHATGDIITDANLTLTGSIATTGARVTKGWFTDLESTNDITIGGTALAAIYEPLLVNSAGLAAALSDETGTVLSVFNTAPTFETSITLGTLIDNVTPSFKMVSDADSDGGPTTSDTFELSIAPNATPTSAVYNFTSTQTTGWVFDDRLYGSGITGNMVIGGYIGTNSTGHTIGMSLTYGQKEGVPGVLIRAEKNAAGGSHAYISTGSDANSVYVKRMFFNGSTGYVGIGTDAPAHKLHLVGNIALGDTTTGDTDAIIYFGDDAAVNSEYFKWDDGDDRFELSDDLDLAAKNLTMTGSIATTGARVVKGWFTDIEVTNDITIGGTALGSTYQPLHATLTSLAGLTETNGGIPYGTADNAYAWLAAGAQGTLLMGNGAGAPSFLGAGTAGYALLANGANDPVWTQLDSDDLSDVASIGMLDEAEGLTASWTPNSDQGVDWGSSAKKFNHTYGDTAHFNHYGGNSDFEIGASGSDITFDADSLKGSPVAALGVTTIAGNVGATTYGSNASVTDAELLHINTLSSNAQDQFNLKAPLASPLFTTQIAIGDAVINESELEVLDDLSTSRTQLNYLSSSTGTTGTTNTNIVFSTSPSLVTPVLGTATATKMTVAGASADSLFNSTSGYFATNLLVTGNLKVSGDLDVGGDGGIVVGSDNATLRANNNVSIQADYNDNDTGQIGFHIYTLKAGYVNQDYLWTLGLSGSGAEQLLVKGSGRFKATGAGVKEALQLQNEQAYAAGNASRLGFWLEETGGDSAVYGAIDARARNTSSGRLDVWYKSGNGEVVITKVMEIGDTTTIDPQVLILDPVSYTEFNGVRLWADTLTLADEAETIVTGDGVTGDIGWGEILVGDNEEYAHFRFTSAAVVTLTANSANVVNTDTDTKFCIYDGGSVVYLKNRLGAAKKIMVTCHYYK